MESYQKKTPTNNSGKRDHTNQNIFGLGLKIEPFEWKKLEILVETLKLLRWPNTVWPALSEKNMTNMEKHPFIYPPILF